MKQRNWNNVFTEQIKLESKWAKIILEKGNNHYLSSNQKNGKYSNRDWRKQGVVSWEITLVGKSKYYVKPAKSITKQN